VKCFERGLEQGGSAVRHSILVVGLVLVGGLLTVPAHADLAPPDACAEAEVGKACENASANGKMDQPGTCQKSKCTRATPSGKMEYDCHLCKAGSSGKDDGGCSFSGRSERTALATAPLLILGLLYGRRRRSSKA
jgi:hypothetical protein